MYLQAYSRNFIALPILTLVILIKNYAKSTNTFLSQNQSNLFRYLELFDNDSIYQDLTIAGEMCNN